jgi:hypothetical protein
MFQIAILVLALPFGAARWSRRAAVTATKSLRRLLAAGALVAVVTVGAAAPALAHPPDPCVKPGPAVSGSRAS